MARKREEDRERERGKKRAARKEQPRKWKKKG